MKTWSFRFKFVVQLFFNLPLPVSINRPIRIVDALRSHYIHCDADMHMVEICTIVACTKRRCITATLVGANYVAAHLCAIVCCCIQAFIHINTSTVSGVVHVARLTTTFMAARQVDAHLVTASAAVPTCRALVDVGGTVRALPAFFACARAVDRVAGCCVGGASALASTVFTEGIFSADFAQVGGVLEVAGAALAHVATRGVAALGVRRACATAHALVHVVHARGASPARLACAGSCHVIARFGASAVARTGTRAVGSVITLGTCSAGGAILVQQKSFVARTDKGPPIRCLLASLAAHISCAQILICRTIF